jgi:hypothetical protein
MLNSISALLCYGLALLSLPGSAYAQSHFFRAEVAQLNALLAYPAGAPETAVAGLLDATVDLEELSRRAFGDYLERSLSNYAKLLDDDRQRDLIAQYERQLIAVFRRRLIADLGARLRDGTVLDMRVVKHNLEGRKGTIELLAESPDGPLAIRGELQRQAEGWRIADLTIADVQVSSFYHSLCEDILKKRYSLPVLTARLEDRDYVVLEDFSSTAPGRLPMDWGSWRPKDQKKPKLYQVEGADRHRYLAAQDTGHSVILGKFSYWNPREFPIMTWCWRVDALPLGGDERYNDTNDSAAGLYVVFSRNWLGVPKQLKYVWSSTLPVGTVGRRNMIARPWFFVLESGQQNLGRWVFEQVNLEAHHRLKLGGKPADRTISLGILTDANSTRSYAEAYYADLRVWKREALEEGRIDDYCGCLPEALPLSEKRRPPDRR